MKKLLFLIVGVIMACAVQAQTVIYSENFELPSLGDSLTASGTPNPWAVNTRIFAAGARCDSNYVQASDTSYLTTGVINCSSYANVVLKFSHICKIEVLDAGEVEISINNGAWTKLTGAQYINPGPSQFVTNGNKFNAITYTVPNMWNYAVADAKPLNSWWMPEQFDISALAGNQANVRLRFVLRDGTTNGANYNHGWFIDNIQVLGAVSELTAPIITYKPPVLQDTVFSTGPYDIFAWIKDASGIDTAWMVYTINGGASNYVPMVWISDSTYKGTIPSCTWGTTVTYYVHAEDNSLSHNATTAITKSFYVKQGPSVIIVGTGTATVSFPYYTWYHDSRTQMIYQAADITAAGGGSGMITAIAFNVSSAAPQVMNGFNIMMQNTSASTLSGFVTTGWTTVYSGTYSVPGTGWQTITLQTPFAWNGTSNLLVSVCFDNTSYTSSSTVLGTTSTNATWGYATDGSTGCSMTGGSAQSATPNIRLTFPPNTNMFDAGVAAVTYPLGTLIGTGPKPVRVTLKNYSIDTLTTVKIKYKVDGIVRDSIQWNGSLFAGMTSAEFPIDTTNFGIGQHTIKAWTVLPNGSADQAPLNDTANITFFVCDSLLNGTYTIGGGGDFATFASAIGALNNCGIGGPVTFLVANGTYNEANVINAVSGASAVNTITFKPNTGATVLLTNNSTSATLKLNGADYIVFDGSNNGTTTRDMTIENTNTGTSTTVVWIAGPDATNAASNNTFKNLIISGNTKTTTLSCVHSGNPTTISTGSYALVPNNNNTFLNNRLYKSQYGMVILGVNATSLTAANAITDCEIGGTNTARGFTFSGIYAAYVDGLNVSGCDIQNINSASNDVYGISLYDAKNCIVAGNEVHNVQYTGASTYKSNGIFHRTTNFTVVGNPSNNNTYNNFVYNVTGTGTSAYYNVAGIHNNGGYGDKYYYNSVYMTGAMAGTGSTAVSGAFMNGNTNISGACSNIVMKNNIFVMAGTAPSAANLYAHYTNLSTYTGSVITNNDLFTNVAAPALGRIGGYNTINYTSLATWQTATSMDAASVSVDPVFTNPTNLHTFAIVVNAIGTPVAGITTDIDGEVRNVTTPDLGADEFAPLANDISIQSILAPLNGCGYSNEAVSIRVKNFGSAPILTAEMYYSINGGAPVHETFNGNIASNTTYDYIFTALANVTAPGTYIIDAWVDLVGDPNNLNDTINNYSFYSGYDFAYGPYTMGFESTENYSDWTILDVNADTRTWQIPFAGASTAHSGTNSARFYNSTTLSGNDWLFSRCFTLNTGSTYKVEYWYRVDNVAGPQNITLKYGATPNVVGMTSTLNTLSAITNTTYQKATATFTATSTGAFYFGWQATSNASSYNAYIDDINIVLVPDQEAQAVQLTAPATGCGLSNAEVITLDIKNTGALAINGNLTAYYKINAAAPVSEAVAASITAGSTLSFSFTLPVDMSVTTVDSTFNIKAWIALTGDPMPFNDTVNVSVVSKHVPVPPIVVNDTVQWGTFGVLHATAIDTVLWYDAPTGGNLLHVGDDFTTPVLYGTTVYYPQASLYTPAMNFTIGTGTTGSSFPFYTFYHDARTHMLFTAAEIAAAGGTPGSIESIALNVTSVASQVMNGFNISMQNTALTSMTNFVETGWTNVYSGTYTVPATGWQPITLQTPFVWDGTSNLLVSICFDNTSYTSSSTVNASTATGMTWAYNTDGSTGCTMTGGFASSSRPNVRFMSAAKIGCSSARVPDTMFTALFPYEAGILSLDEPLGGCSNGFENVTFTMVNNGSAAINTFDATYQANAAPVITETFVTNQLPGDTMSYTFTTLLNLGISSAFPDTTIDLNVWVDLASDANIYNDSVSGSFDFSLTAPNPVVSNTTIPYATSTTITAIAVDSVSWYDALTGGNLLGELHSYTTPVLFGTTVYYAEAASTAAGLYVDGLFTTGSAVVDHDTYTGDDRGGIAITQNYCYVNGDNNAVRFDMPGLTNPVSYNKRDGILSDLSGTGTIYTLWNGTIDPVGTYLSSAYSVTSLKPLNADLSLAAATIPLSQTITMGSGSDCAIFSGQGFAILYNGTAGVPANTYYRIDLPSGVVTVLGNYTLTAATGENWARWGIAEVNNDEYSVVYVQNSTAISRLNLSTGAVTSVNTYSGLSDMMSITIAPWYNRWYFHHEYNSTQFGGSSETAGYADALMTFNLGCPSERIADTVFVTGAPPCDMSIISISSPVSGVELSSTETVTVTVHNFGTNPASNIPVNYSINGGAPVTEIIPGPMAPGAEIVYTFTATANLSVVDTYTLWAYTSLACDAVTVNDSVLATIVNDPLVYCTSAASSTWDNDIGNVTFSNINNGTASPILNNGTCVNMYTDYTALPAAQIIAGASEPISITKIEDGSWYYDCQVNVYIDWNRNGTWELPGELVFGASTGSDENFPTVSGVVNVPTTGVVLGENLLMRVVEDESGSAPPCGAYTWGETEDYFVLVSPQLQYDAGVTLIVQPTAIENEGAIVPVQVIVKNFGFDTIKNSTGMFVAYSLNGLAPVSTAWTGGNLAPGASAAFSLPNITVPSGNDEICAWTSMVPDSNFGNDSTCKNFYGNPNYDAGVTSFIQPASLNGFENAVVTVEVVIENLGADTLTSVPVSYTVNGMVPVTEMWSGILLPGASINVAFTQTFVTPAGGYDLCAYTGLVIDGDHSNDTTCITPYGLFTSTLPYYDDFDGLVNWSGDPDGNGNVWEHGVPSYGTTNSAHSAPYAWDVNLSTVYTPGALAYLYTQNFDFSTAVSAKMSFWFNVGVEDCCDGLTVQYSTDSSATWQTLGIIGDPNGLNWYTTSTGGYPSWVSNGGWEKAEYLCSVLNYEPSVRFRFLFHSDGSVETSGASIDDFSLSIPSPIDAGVEQIKTPTGYAPAGSSKTVRVLVRNFGTDTLTSIPLSYTINGGAPVNATWAGQLVSNDTITYTFATPFIVPGGAFDICSYTRVIGDGDNLNDTTCSLMTGVVTFVVPWSDDMEGTIYEFADGGNLSWEWGVPTSVTINTAHSPTHCWKTNLDGYYSNSSADYLYTPYFDFTQVLDATLDFWHWYQTESGVDGGKIEYSLNGTTWVTLGYVGDPAATNWYTANISGSPHWTGNSAGWIHSTYNLSTIPTIVNATVPVQFRYKFFSSASTNNYDGWAVDDLAIIAPPIAKDAGVSAILAPVSSTVTGSSVTVQVTIMNYGTDTLQSVPVAYAVNGGAFTLENWTGVLNPAATANYTFTTPFTSPSATYNLCAFTKKTGDFYKFNDTTCVSIGALPAPDDAGCILVLNPSDSTIAGDSITVQIRIQNFGTNTLTSIPVGYSRNAVQIATAIWTGNLAAGATADYTFTQKYVSPMSNYSLCGYTMLPGDADANNDQTCAYPLGYVGMDEYAGEDFYLWQNAPNPANNVAYIEYQIPSNGMVKFEVRDLLGQLLFTQSQNTASGRHHLELNVSPYSTGLYYYSIEFEGQRLTRKMVISK